MKEAHQALRAGNGEAAVARLQREVKRGPRTPHEDIQIARRLLVLSASFRNGGDLARGRQVANLSLARIAQPEGRMPVKDAAASHMLAGEIHELWADVSAAKHAYQSAIALDPGLQHASTRLANLIAVETKAREKAAANLLLQQRAAASRRSP